MTFMRKITKEQVEDLAKLARLGLTDAEKTSLAREMTAILEYSMLLDEVDTKGVQPTSQTTELKNIFRKDCKVISDIDINEKLQNAPVKEKSFIKVKKVLE